jgi:hypothetical protein
VAAKKRINFLDSKLKFNFMAYLRHVRQLVSDDRLVNQSLAERLSLVRISESFFVADTSASDGLNNNAPSL